MIILTSGQIRQVEQTAVKGGMDFLRLMENAGSACARVIKERIAHMGDIENAAVTVVSGKGKNGGDGFVIARKLCESGAAVTIVLAQGVAAQGESLDMYERLKGLPLKIISYSEQRDESFEAVLSANVLVDCVFGIGLRGVAPKEIQELFRAMSANNGYKVAIDIPSGVESDVGEVKNDAVAVSETIAISTLKPAHVLMPASLYCGNTTVVRIGIPENIITESGSVLYCADMAEISSNFKERNPVSSKGDYGRVLSICGSRNMPGAAVLAAGGAVVGGAGLVACAFPEKAYAAIASKLTEPILVPLPTNEYGTLSAECIPSLLKAMEKATAILIGCGLGVNPDTAEIAKEVLLNAKCPVIVDADGINIISQNIDILEQIKAPVILTPHPGEMGRLLDLSSGRVQSDRLGIAKSFAARYNVTLVLKGANTLIAKHNKNEIYVNTTGNPGMARGGSGDLLAGIIASFAAQGMPEFNACYCAAYVHGLAGDRAAKKYSMTSMTPTDMIEELKTLL